ncbi:3'-5' exonuclease [Streptomyces synnematoformans]|uniref:Exonuclease domain-containing protein n=1 Tax=Streptomyces synnematoformans TaxID=415721 RepID=A0ABN2XI60_9ACTN
MSSTTAAAEVPASRTEADPERVARAEPCGHVGEVSVYGWGQAPPYLRTQTQLGGERLKLADGQQPLAYLRTRDYGDVPLYDLAGAVKMKPLGSKTKAAMRRRRTCPQCGKVRTYVVRRQCDVCNRRAQQARERKQARTCWDCRKVFPRPLPKEHHRCGGCRRKQLAELRRKAAEWVERVTVCAGEECSVKLVTKKEARAHQRQQSLHWGSWSRAAHWPLRCPPCTETEDRRQADQRARREQEERERQEAERQAARARVRWAAEALVDPDVVVLDTETTGLHGTARIVEIAVLSSSGEVLLDTLVDPSGPIPAEASQLHGITTEMVAGAPAFSRVLPDLERVLEGKRCLIYNDVYDLGRLRHELTLHHLDHAARASASTTTAGAGAVAEEVREQALAAARTRAAAWVDALHVEDVMGPYSDWVGDWNDYWGNNEWQALRGGHRAAGDCRAVLDCLRAMKRSGEHEGGEGDLDEGEAL